MKIELIVPAVEENAPIPNLGLPILAALSPPDVEISITDDLLTPIDLEKDLKEVDLVGITVLTKTALRAYEIADGYRKKGIPVVLGGIHPTALPEEAKEHADSVVMGEAEEVWPSLIEDFRIGNLKSFYRQERFTELSKIPRPRREILPRKGYFPLDVIQATRGCPFRCEFCSVRKFFGDTYRFRPISEVVEEMKTLRHRLIMFNDDNIIGNPFYSKELLKALIPLKKKWIGQASLSGLRDAENVALLAKSGCIGLLIGFESLSKSNLIQSQKYQNDPTEYREVIHTLHRFGISIWGSFIFGFDEDDPSIFEETVAFAIQTKLFSVVFALLTPYPETAFYQRVKEEGRLVQDQWWLLERQEESAPFFIPKKMSSEVLREGWKRAWKEFYSFPSIWKRFHWDYSPTLINRFVYFPFQWMQHRFTKKKILEGRRRYRTRSF
ncbi:MAG: B12-binding domain-containing radical SAM protein [Desulfobacterales bacterium]|nr:B12-binding domain-containing radical SAM protein [Desulfobacterales bacterium]